MSGAGRLGQTYRFAVNRGETITHEITLDQGRLLDADADPSRWGPGDRPREEPRPFALVTQALELSPGRFDFVEMTRQTVLRRDAVTGQPVWDASSPKDPYASGHDPRAMGAARRLVRLGAALIEPAVDLDGDGTRDILAVVADANAFFALSGKDGRALWNYAAEPDGPGGPRPEGPTVPTQPKPSESQGQLIGWPAVGDIDGDGTADLVATMRFRETPSEVERRIGKPPTPMTPVLWQRMVLAISGRSGRSLWVFPIDREFTTINRRLGNGPAALLAGAQSTLVAIVDGSRVSTLEAATGRPRAGAFDLAFEPVRPVQYADLDGDGRSELVALGPGPSANQQTIAAYTIGTGQERWTATVAAKYPLPHENAGSREWPWLLEIEGKGRTDVVVPDSGPLPPKGAFRGVSVLEGVSGKSRFKCPMRPDTKADDSVEHVLDAPDLNGDGARELVAVSRFQGRNPPASRADPREEPEHIYVDVLSGRDGHPFWSWHMSVPENKFTWTAMPRWWARGPDGWPVLAVPLAGTDPERPWSGGSSGLTPALVCMLEASTGRELNRAKGISRLGAADLDGDGLIDLWGEADGQLRAFAPSRRRRGGPSDRISPLGRVNICRWEPWMQRPLTSTAMVSLIR